MESVYKVADPYKSSLDDRLTDPDKTYDCLYHYLAIRGIRCTSCGYKFHQPDYPTKRIYGYKDPVVLFVHITRIIGYDAKELLLELKCKDCDHSKTIDLKCNPLFDAGIMERK